MIRYSFSVRPAQTKSAKVVADIRAHCKATGTSFSHIVLQALAKYQEEVLNGKK